MLKKVIDEDLCTNSSLSWSESSAYGGSKKAQELQPGDKVLLFGKQGHINLLKLWGEPRLAQMTTLTELVGDSKLPFHHLAKDLTPLQLQGQRELRDQFVDESSTVPKWTHCIQHEMG